MKAEPARYETVETETEHPVDQKHCVIYEKVFALINRALGTSST